jgi:hypothetical protein
LVSTAAIQQAEYRIISVNGGLILPPSAVTNTSTEVRAAPLSFILTKNILTSSPLLSRLVWLCKGKAVRHVVAVSNMRPSAGGWQISSPDMLGSSSMEGALQITLEAGIENIRKKSLLITGLIS